jgi:hypothetical protein
MRDAQTHALMLQEFYDAFIPRLIDFGFSDGDHLTVLLTTPDCVSRSASL